MFAYWLVADVLTAFSCKQIPDKDLIIIELPKVLLHQVPRYYVPPDSTTILALMSQ